MAGYSGKPLVEKLGVKSGMRCIFLNAPENYSKTLGPLPQNVMVITKLQGSFDFIQAFHTEKKNLGKRFPLLKKRLASNGMLWISWPKGASGVTTDLNENVVREMGLDIGLVDVKVCAVDEIWSGLKFVYRLHDRPSAGSEP